VFGLPQGKDMSFLVERELIQVCIGLHQVILVFDGDISISLECEFYLTHGSEIGEEAKSSNSSKTALAKLLGSHITSVTNRGGRELGLFFSGGLCLRILDSNSDHESYQISLPTETIIV
jgi:hypothetical protein